MEPQKVEIGGKTYIIHDGDAFNDRPDMPEPLSFSTLSGLVEYVEGEFDKDFILGRPIIHVKGPKLVEFFSEAQPPYAQRCLLAKVVPQLPDAFPFGSFMSGEEFMIKLQALFVQNGGGWRDVIEACAGIKKQDGIEYKDSGVTQTVAVQSGISLASMKKLPNPVSLVPYRTFAEVEQPTSAFVLRATDGRLGPELALFEADGGAWRLEATRSVKEWLKERLPDYTVIA